MVDINLKFKIKNLKPQSKIQNEFNHFKFWYVILDFGIWILDCTV